MLLVAIPSAAAPVLVFEAERCSGPRQQTSTDTHTAVLTRHTHSITRVARSSLQNSDKRDSTNVTRQRPGPSDGTDNTLRVISVPLGATATHTAHHTQRTARGRRHACLPLSPGQTHSPPQTPRSPPHAPDRAPRSRPRSLTRSHLFSSSSRCLCRWFFRMWRSMKRQRVPSGSRASSTWMTTSDESRTLYSSPQMRLDWPLSKIFSRAWAGVGRLRGWGLGVEVRG